MKPEIYTYEKSVVFAQKIIENKPMASFAGFADLDYIVKNDILSFDEMKGIDIGDSNDDFAAAIKLPAINIKIMGTIEKFIISLIDAEDTDSNLKNTVKSFSNFLLNEQIGAIGYNMKLIHEVQKSETLFNKKLISICPPIISNADAASFKITHDYEDSSLNISLDTGKLKHQKVGEKEGILIGYNYHQEIKGQSNAKSKIQKFTNSLNEIENTISEKNSEIESYFYE